MRISRPMAAITVAGVAALAAIPLLAQRAPTSGPVARYDMRAGTMSGMAAMAGGGMRAGLGALLGRGGNQPVRELHLRLGSANGPDRGTPRADHFMPSGARLGRSVPLTTPREERSTADELPGEREGQRPTGRILIYWGCGEHAPRGQPVVIDLARLSAGQVPPGLWSTTILRDWGPTLANSRTFGHWPGEDNRPVRHDASLLGAHRIAGNYSPEIAFTLAKDFMQPLASSVAAQPSGAAVLSWGAIPDATGYVATLFGGRQGPNGQMGDMVMWSSSASRQFGGGLSDWLTPAQVAGLVRDRTVMAPSTTTCTIPAEVRRDAPDFRMGTLTAFGPEENFSYPPRPEDPRAAWNLAWTARVRHRSTTGWMDMPGMAGQQQPQQQQECRRGGILGGVLGPRC